MEIIKIYNDDYDEVLKIFKTVLDNYYFLTSKNEQLNDLISNYYGSLISSKATHGYFIINQKKQKIGIILFNIPNKNLLFNKQIIENDLNKYEFKTFLNSDINPIESQLIKFRIDTIKNSINLHQKYEKFIWNKAEILVIFVDENQRNRGLGKILISKFFDDIKKFKINEFFLYTTNLSKIAFFENLNMNKFEKIIYDENNCPNFLAQKIELPYFGYLYFGKIY